MSHEPGWLPMSQAPGDGTWIRIAFQPQHGPPQAARARRVEEFGKHWWYRDGGIVIPDEECLGFHLIEPLPAPPSERVEEPPIVCKVCHGYGEACRDPLCAECIDGMTDDPQAWACGSYPWKICPKATPCPKCSPSGDKP